MPSYTNTTKMLQSAKCNIQYVLTTIGNKAALRGQCILLGVAWGASLDMVQELMTSTLSFDRTVRTAESPTYGAWHAVVVGRDDCAVEALSNVKAIHVVAGDYTTFVVFDDGDVYSFGCGQSASLGHNAVGNDE
ncbi:hypothetical protein JHK82_027570 [Glycine max]|nr:hypothetical protein JHK85_028227 [Glycine max]KAG5126735.1 hypothetical protein JHK82_027570 [Glycine max]